MTTKYLFLTYVVDRSGSMISCGFSVFSGLKKSIQDKIKLAEDMGFTLRITIYTFDYDVNRIELPEDPNEFTDSDYTTIKESIVPRGNTRLYDAIDEAIDYTRGVYSSLNEDEKSNASTFMVIITDGEDNMSTIKQTQIQDKVKVHISEGSEYIYLGANINATRSGACIGINPNACLQFTPDPRHTTLVFNSLGLAMQRSITGEDTNGPQFKPHERQTSCSTDDQLQFGIGGGGGKKHTDTDTDNSNDANSDDDDDDGTRLLSTSGPSSLDWIYDSGDATSMPWDTPVETIPPHTFTPNPNIPRLDLDSVLSQTCTKIIDPSVPKTPVDYTPPSLTTVRATTADPTVPRLTRMTNFNGLEYRSPVSPFSNDNEVVIDMNDASADIFADYSFITKDNCMNKSEDEF